MLKITSSKLWTENNEFDVALIQIHMIFYVEEQIWMNRLNSMVL